MATLTYLMHSKLREQEGKDEEDLDQWTARKLLLPIARGLCVNWETGNRREAGETLSHITGSGPVASAIVSSMSKTLKKVRLGCCIPFNFLENFSQLIFSPQLNPVRLLEAHMACLRSEFEAWAESEPEEPEGENPSDEDLAAFEEAEKIHDEKVRMESGLSLCWFFSLTQHAFPFNSSSKLWRRSPNVYPPLSESGKSPTLFFRTGYSALFGKVFGLHSLATSPVLKSHSFWAHVYLFFDSSPSKSLF